MKKQSLLLTIALCLMLLLCAAEQAHARSSSPVPPSSRGALDIGPVGSSGGFTENGDTDRVWGSGSDIWGQSDQFHYVWYELPGDGQMLTQVQSQDGTRGWAKAGIMLRETVAANATNVLLALTPGHGVTFQWRAAANAQTNYQPGPKVTGSSWLKLVRYGSTITGFVSVDGTAWTIVKTVKLTMGATSSIGLAVTAHDNTLRSSAIFSHVTLTRGSQPPALTAKRIYGQNGNFTSNTVNNGGISADSLKYPGKVAFDASGNLYVADYSNNRVLYYPAGSTTATRVYGQNSSFTSNTANNGGVSATSLFKPWEVALDSSGNLYVTDYGNNRVLSYPVGSTTAMHVYGQNGSFTSNTANNGGVSTTSLNTPDGIALDSGGNLYVSDASNNRVLYYPVGNTTATRVYGQNGGFTSKTANNGGVSATSLNVPYGIALDNSGNLYVADSNNNRVLYYPIGSTTATRVYGQNASFTSNTANNGGISADSLSAPIAVALDNSGNLYVADSNNNRVLYYPVGSTTATRVYGQNASFTSNTANNGGISAGSLNDAENVALDNSGNLYIADSSNNRVLMFPYA